jgi:hypothetical protein
MPQVGFEPTISLFERAKTVHCDRRVVSLNIYKLREPGELSRYSDGLREGRPSSIPGKDKRCSSIAYVQTGSGAHPASYTMGTWTLSPGGGVKRPGREVDCSPPLSAEVKNGEVTSQLPHTSSWLNTETTLPFYSST